VRHRGKADRCDVEAAATAAKSAAIYSPFPPRRWRNTTSCTHLALFVAAAALPVRPANSRTRSACATSVVARSGKGDLLARSCPVHGLTHHHLLDRVSEHRLSPRATVAIVSKCLVGQDYPEPINHSGD
jgi:hypothetical protein